MVNCNTMSGLSSSLILFEVVDCIATANPTKDIFFYYYGIDSIRVGAGIRSLNVHVKKMEKVRDILPLRDGCVTVVGLFDFILDEDWISLVLRKTDYLLKLEKSVVVPSSLEEYAKLIKENRRNYL